MKEALIQEISNAMADILSFDQLAQLNSVLLQAISRYTVLADGEQEQTDAKTNDRLLDTFLSAKQVEGCTPATIKYYGATIRNLFKQMPKKVTDYTTEDIRAYLAVFQRKRKSSKTTMDNIRRILSSYFSWLEEEDHILKTRLLRATPTIILNTGMGVTNGHLKFLTISNITILPVQQMALIR